MMKNSKLRFGLALAGSLATLGGCNRISQRFNRVDMNARINDVPPIKVEALDGRHMLVMRAPNPGWEIAIDRDEREPHAVRVYITIRRPDPGFMYPQVIVDKRVLSEVPTDKTLQIHARLLGAGETTSGRGYAPLAPAEHFED